MILTSNRAFAEWAEVFDDPVVVTALLDRLLHHEIVIQIEGASYRLRAHTDLLLDTTETRRNAVSKKDAGDRLNKKRRFRSIIPADYRSTKCGEITP